MSRFDRVGSPKWRRFLIVAGALAFGSTAWAQNPAVQPFIPQGWNIVQAKALDLDGDGRSDRILVLEQLDTEGATESRQLEGPRSLVLLKGTPNGFRMMARASEAV